MRQKILFIGAGIIVLLIIGGVAYSMRSRGDSESKMQNQKQEDVSTLALDTKYTDEAYKISFQYPSSFNVSKENTGEGDMIVASSKGGQGFQIYVSTHEGEDVNITKESLLKDIPDLDIRNEQEVIIGNSGKGIAFVSSESGSDVRDIWFIARGHLYQITAPMTSDELLKKVLNTWKFE